jgi:hypothetical protein
LELAFSTKALRDLCLKREVAINQLGPLAAQELATILADIQAVETVDELCALHGQQMRNPEPGSKSVVLKSGYTLKFSSGHPLTKGTELLEIDWAAVTRIRIQGVETDNE